MNPLATANCHGNFNIVLINYYKKHIYKFEADASELLENLEDIFPRY